MSKFFISSIKYAFRRFYFDIKNNYNTLVKVLIIKMLNSIFAPMKIT
ncbi:hypothetical protein SAMN05660845_1503 [Flavobacterium swingsii]|jgi:hypothetical protein|uniref:Uncharacterized protein n=1 Tax=Flavobacterium swingsii TaxID=498292 RepID=A0A1I0XTP6_9FLAO|nr:hypothetical protein SAMN05660845_1503 [Flavobacterium swingsii]